MIWGAGLYLAGTQEEAIRRVEPAHDERYKWFAPFGFVRYADEQGRTWGTPGAPARIPSLRDGVAAEGVVLRHAGPGDRRHQVDRGEVSRAGGLHDPLGRGPVAGGVRRAAALVRPRRDAGVRGIGGNEHTSPAVRGRAAKRTDARRAAARVRGVTHGRSVGEGRNARTVCALRPSPSCASRPRPLPRSGRGVRAVGVGTSLQGAGKAASHRRSREARRDPAAASLSRTSGEISDAAWYPKLEKRETPISAPVQGKRICRLTPKVERLRRGQCRRKAGWFSQS